MNSKFATHRGEGGGSHRSDILPFQSQIEPSLRRLVASFTQRHASRHFAAPPEVGHGDCVASLVTVHHVGDVLRAGHVLIVNGNDQVSTEEDLHVAEVGGLASSAQTGALRSPAWNSSLDEDSIVGCETHLLGEIRTNGQRHNAQGGPADAAIFLEVAEDGLGRVDGDGEADARALLYVLV